MPREARESNASVAWQVQNLLRKMERHQHGFLQIELDVVGGLAIGVLPKIVKMTLKWDPPPKETK
jgi:hypothetical protein